MGAITLTVRTSETMALPPKFSGQLLASASQAEAKHTIELYLDYVCPFSAKMFKTFYNEVVPLIEKKYTNPGVRVIFRQRISQQYLQETCETGRFNRRNRGEDRAGLTPCFGQACRRRQLQYWESSDKRCQVHGQGQ